MKYDLHCHSTVSDGVLPPDALMRHAVERRIDVLALTDHDTVDGLALARHTIAAEQLPLQLVSGVEISTAWHDFEIHVVGLAVNDQDSQLRARLDSQRERRLERAREMARRLTKHQVPDCLDAVLQLAAGGAVTRNHFARHLVAIGKAANVGQVFKHYLARGKAGYVPNNWVELAEAVQWIHDAGGIAVLAHPLKYNLSGKWLRRLATEFRDAGGDAIEVVSCQMTPVQKREVWTLAQPLGLVASQGSDFHQITTWNDLGRGLYMTDDIETVWQRFADKFPQQSLRQQEVVAAAVDA